MIKQQKQRPFSRLMIIVVFTVSSLQIWALPENIRISYIRIEGLKRTKPETVKNIIDYGVGDKVTSETKQEIENRLQKSNLFASTDVRIDISGREAEVLIKVSEKWTLIPIPFFSTDGNTVSAGMILMETNLMGLNKQLITAGFGSTGGYSGFLMYNDPSIWGSRWSGTISSGFGTDETETVRTDKELIRKYETIGERVGMSIGYRFSEQIRTHAFVQIAATTIESFTPGIDTELLPDRDSIATGLEVRYYNTVSDGVLLTGPEATLKFSRLVSEEGWELSTSSSLGIPLFDKQRLRLLISGGYGEMPVLEEKEISAQDGYRTLPYQQTRADKWGSASLFYDFPLLTTEWGALVLSHYWEAGAYDTEQISPSTFYGPGAAFRIYLKQIALPALGLDAAYNMKDEYWVISFSIGMRK